MAVPGAEPDLVETGPGFLYFAVLGSAEPTNPSAALPSAWLPAGYTDAGHTLSYAPTFSDVDVAEEPLPIRSDFTSYTASMQFSLAQQTAANVALAWNLGPTGFTTAGGVNVVEPPDIGEEIRMMLAWQALNKRKLLVARKCIQTGNVQIARQKAPAKALVPCDFRFEPVVGAKPFSYYSLD
jgi:hypothetical protein